LLRLLFISGLGWVVRTWLDFDSCDLLLTGLAPNCIRGYPVI